MEDIRDFKHDQLTPTVHGPRMRWNTVHGFTYLCGRSCWRYFVTGVPLRGAGDNATFLHDATEDYRRRPVQKLSRARWRRVVRRWLAIGVPAPLIAVAYVMGGWWTVAAWAYTVGLPISLLGLGGYRAWQWWPDRRIQREYVKPAAAQLLKVTGADYPRRHAAKLIQVPAGFGRGLEGEQLPVRVYMPGTITLSAPKQQQIARQVGSRLGLPDASQDWQLTGSRPYVDLMPKSLPPKVVTWQSFIQHMDKADRDNPVVMLSASGPISYSYVNDSPHVLLSGGAGTGKSTLARTIIAQRIRRGVGQIMLDYKRWSHDWMHDLPEYVCQYWHRIEDIHNAGIAIGDELERRKNLDTRQEMEAQRQVDVWLEEANSLIVALQQYWDRERARIVFDAKAREKDDPGSVNVEELNPPKRSPAVKAIQFAVNMGRELGIFVHLAGQRVSAGVFGGNGGDIRESFQTRFVSKWNKPLWKMLCDGIPYEAFPSGPRGIWGVKRGDDFVIGRVPYCTGPDARAYAMGGDPVYGPVLGVQTDTPYIESVRTEALPYGDLRTICDRLPDRPDGTRLSYEALKKASVRTGFPDPVRTDSKPYTYAYADVHSWHVRRDGVQIEA